MNRFDNLAHVLRSAGVDASATRLITGHRVRQILDERWRTFSGIGVGSSNRMPCFQIDLDSFVPFMRQQHRLVLSGPMLLGEVLRSKAGDNRNGVQCWDQPPKKPVAAEIVRHLRDGGAPTSSVLVLALDPSGIPLTNFPTNSYRGFV